MGKVAQKLAHLDVEKLMREDIDEARKRLNIGEPVIYRQCLAQLMEEGFEAQDLGLTETQLPEAQAA